MTEQIPTPRLYRYFGAHLVPQRDEQELRRVKQRSIITLVILLYWIYEYATDPSTWSTPKSIAFFLSSGLLLSNILYGQRLQRSSGSGIGAQHAYLALDPAFLVMAVAVDPERLSFLNSLLLIVVIATGIRYGTRSMWLSWVATYCAALALLPFSTYWQREREMAMGLGLMLALVPVFFVPLVYRIHNVRAIEQERARLNAMDDIVGARSAFLSKVSHELRSPLQSIVSALDVFEMRHGHRLAEDDELIARMRRSSMLMNTQLRDLQTLAKGQAGRLQTCQEPVEASALVEGVALAAREAAQAKGLSLKVALPEGPMFVVADGARIDQVLTNLVVNSIRYTSAGSVLLTLHPYDVATKRLHFTVADTGPGIPAALLPRLLEPDTLETGGVRKGEGSGIGLAVVRTLVDLMGGVVSVWSREGAGTTFDVHIPAELIDADEPLGAPRSGGDRVLIVDDREDVLDALTSVANGLGYECDRAATAALALRLLGERRYDAVLLDIQMPGKSGAEIAAETRAGHGPNRDTRLLGMSAAEVTALYSEGPFDACLTKPIDRNALASALREEWPESWPTSTV